MCSAVILSILSEREEFEWALSIFMCYFDLLLLFEKRESWLEIGVLSPSRAEPLFSIPLCEKDSLPVTLEGALVCCFRLSESLMINNPPTTYCLIHSYDNSINSKATERV